MFEKIGVWILEFGIDIKNLIEPALNLFREDGLGPFLAFVIFVTGVIIAVIAGIKYGGYIRNLNKAVNNLGSFKDEEEFHDDYERIKGFFDSGDGLDVCWREFTETIIYPHTARPGGHRPIIRNTSRPADFFDADLAGYTTPILRTFPNIYVGIGLFITFAGLIAALTAAVEGIDGRAVEEMQSSLGALLITTSAKFYTSMVALGVSIFLTILFRVLESSRDKLFKKFSDKIERGMHYVSTEEIADEQLKVLKEQNIQLQQFNTDIAMKLGSHIEEAVTKAMDPIAMQLASMGQNLGQNNLDAMREIGEAIAKNVQGATGESLQHLSEKLDSLTGVLGNMSSDLTKSTEQFEGDITNALSGMKLGVEEMVNHLKGNAQEMAQNLQESALDTSNVLSGKLDELTTNLGSAANNINQAAASVASSLESASAGAGETVRNAMEAAGAKAAEDIGAAGNATAKALEDSIGTLSSAMKDFEASLGTAMGSMNGMKDDLERTSGVISQMNTDIGTSAREIRDASGSVANMLRPALESVQTIQNAIGQMSSQVSGAVGAIQTAMDQTNISVSQLRDEMQRNGEFWKEHSEKFEGVNENLAQVFDQVNKHIENSQERMGDFVIKMDGSFNDALAALQNAVEEFSEVIEEMKEEGERSVNNHGQ